MSDNLGNACLTSFFVTGSWDHHKLLQSLKAYQNAVSLQSRAFSWNAFSVFTLPVEIFLIFVKNLLIKGW